MLAGPVPMRNWVARQCNDQPQKLFIFIFFISSRYPESTLPFNSQQSAILNYIPRNYLGNDP